MLRRLAKKGVIEEETLVTFGYRTRRLVVNTNLVEAVDIPRSMEALTDLRWRGRVALAYPLHGTTVTHLMALRAQWGEGPWQTWCRKLLANETLVVDGNSAVVRLVGQGIAWLGLTDSDDIAVGLRNGFPIRQVELTQEYPPIANSAAMVVDGPHPNAARLFIEYLQKESTVKRLVELGALEGVEFSDVNHSTIDWSEVMGSFDESYRWLGETFFR
jgi:iron(III) transport system substrate-binding protein